MYLYIPVVSLCALNKKRKTSTDKYVQCTGTCISHVLGYEKAKHAANSCEQQYIRVRRLHSAPPATPLTSPPPITPHHTPAYTCTVLHARTRRYVFFPLCRKDPTQQRAQQQGTEITAEHSSSSIDIGVTQRAVLTRESGCVRPWRRLSYRVLLYAGRPAMLLCLR